MFAWNSEISIENEVSLIDLMSGPEHTFTILLMILWSLRKIGNRSIECKELLERYLR